MPTSYDDGTAFTTAQQHGDLRIVYPFIEYGDATAKVIYRDMIVERTSYAALTVGTALTGVAGSRYVKDEGWTDIGTGLMRYTQIYATVPATHERFDGIVVNLPKAFQDDTNEVLFEGGPTVLPARIEYTFNTSIAALTRHRPFRVVIDSTTFGVNYVRNSIGATDPTRTAFFSTTERVAEASSVQRYMGDIYMAITPYIKPIDAYATA